MLYENYERKMQKVAKVKHVVYKFRFVIAGAVILTSGSAIAFNTVKGDLSGGSYNIPTIIEYGEEYKPKSSALFSNAKFEYCKEGTDNWFNVKPTDAGVYYARAYSYNGFGNKKTGEKFKFEISKKDLAIKVRQTSITYGEKLSYFSTDLIPGDKISEVDYTYEGSDYYNKKVSVSKDKFKIVNEFGNDVTHNYAIDFQQTDLAIKKRNLKISYSTSSTYYDGNTVEGSYTYTGLLDGDQLEINEAKAKITNIGVVSNISDEANIVIKDKDGKTVTHYYNIEQVAGKLTISKRPITITSSSVSREYNGKPLSDSGDSAELSYKTSGEPLLSNHYIDISYQNYGVYASFYGQNVFSYTIREKGTDRDVGEYYDVNPIYGQINITKLPISLASKSVSKTYDGEPLSGLADNENEYITSGRLAPTDKLVYDKTITVTDPTTGNGVSNFLDFKIINTEISEGFNANNCYSFGSTTYGYLKINKIDINVSSNDVNRAYNGKSLSGSTGGELRLTYDSSKILTRLGHHLEYSFNYEGRMHRINAVNDYTLAIFDASNHDVTDLYYNVNYSYGNINISRKDLTITVENKSKVYDGTALTVHQNDLKINGLVSTDRVVLDSANEVINPTNSGSIAQQLNYSVLHENGEDVMDDYNIDLRAGYLRVDRVNIEISTNTIDAVYDGVKYSDTAFDESHRLTVDINYLNGQLLEEHELRTSFGYNNYYVTPNGEYYTNIVYYGIYYKGTTELVENWDSFYNVVENFGITRVAKRGASISSTTDHVYGDGVISRDDLSTTGLRDGDTVEYNGSLFDDEDAIPSGASFSYKITNSATGDDVSDCYNVDVDYSSFIAKTRAIIVDMPSLDVLYDGGSKGESLGTPTIASNSPNDLVSGHYLSLNCSLYLNNAKTYEYGKDFNENSFNVSIYDSLDQVATPNYQIVYTYHPLVIRKRNIEIQIDNNYIEKEFTGADVLENFDASEYFSVLGDGLAGNQTLKVKSKGPIAPGTGTLEIEVGIYDVFNYGFEYTSNYEIDTTLFNFDYNVSKIESLICRTQNDVSKKYDGTTSLNGLTDKTTGQSLCGVIPESSAIHFTTVKNVNYSTSDFRPGVYNYEPDFSDAYFQDEVTKEKYAFSDCVASVVVFKDAQATINARYISFGFASEINTPFRDGDKYLLPFKNSQYRYIPLIAGDGLASGDKTNLNNFEDTALSEVGDSGILGYEESNVQIVNADNEDVTDCYNITVNQRLFEVVPNEITITSLSGEKTFDNRDYSLQYIENVVFTYVSMNIDIEYDWTFEEGSRTNVGIYDNEFEVKSIKAMNQDDELEDVTEFFTINKEYGKLTVNPYYVYYTAYSINKEYNGKSITFSNQEITYSSFFTAGIAIDMMDYYTILDFGLSVRVSYDGNTFIYAGEQEATPTFTWYDTATGQAVEQGNVILVPSENSPANPSIMITTRTVTLTNSKSGKTIMLYGTYEDNEYYLDDTLAITLSTSNSSASLGSGDHIVLNIEGLLESMTPVETIEMDNGEVIRVVTYRAEELNAALNAALAGGKISIYNKNNVDVTYCYNINFNLADIKINYFVVE